MVLEGNEVEGKLGDVGTYKVDINDKGVVEVAVGVKIDIVAELEKLAAKSDNAIDDKIVGIVKAALGRA